jgi:ribonuclease BN (tRNA processing enzyme)
VGRVIFLGTGDPLNGDRAQASLAVPLAGGEAMLFDASSGTVLLRQLETAGILLEGLRHLFVTHRHFDHVGGLAPLLTALAAVPEASLTIHATPQTLAALRDLLSLTIPGVEDWLGGRLCWAELIPGKPTSAGDAEVTPFLVDHGLECVGFRVAQGGSTMVHAADTRPCPNVVEYARGADLLVHEAYGLRDDPRRAHAFGHSTAAEAGRVARDAGVRRLVLTHLRSGRFADPARLAAEAQAVFDGPVEISRDLDAFEF